MLKSRLITAAVLITFFIWALFNASNFAWSLGCFAFTAAASIEWAKLAKLNQAQSLTHIIITLIVGGFVVYFSNQAQQPFSFYLLSLLFTASLIWLVIVPFYLFNDYLPSNSARFKSMLGILIIIGNLIAFIGLHRLSPVALLVIIATVSIADSAAYFGGKQFGKRKLAPTVSPGKTWEGVITAVIVVAIYAFVVSLNFEPKFGIFLGLVSLVFWSVLGDLFESKLKRAARLKDSGNILPGHGGVLDRIDGIMPAATLAFFYIAIVYQKLPIHQ